MRNPLSLLRVLPVFIMLGLAIWIGWPQGVDANSRTYTAEYVPDRIADGFDFPVGANGSAAGYYMARKMTPFGHLGDDWNGVGGGNSDYGDPVYSIADGVVVYSENFGSNWGQVVIVRHKYRESDGSVRKVDSLYGHVIHRRVGLGDFVRRGQQIAQIGNNNGMYLAHLHLEIRSNTEIGIQSWNHSKGLSNYHRPDHFIARHRPGKRVDPGLRLASAESRGAEGDASVKATPAPVAMASVSPVTAPPAKPNRVDNSPPAAQAKPKLVAVGDTVVKPTSSRAGSAVSSRRAEPVLFAGGKKSSKVVDELVSPAKQGKLEGKEKVKGEPHPFFGGGSPERSRRSRKVSRDKPEAAVTKVKTTAARRRSFGKQ